MTQRQTIFLAALLHDIGKFYQRGDDSFSNANLSEQTRNMLDYICPINQKGNFGYQHVLWTNEFFNRAQNKFKDLGLNVNVFDPSAQTENNVVNLAVFHHKPNSLMQAVIQLADWWSSGLDREKDYSNWANTNDASTFKDVTLSSVWEEIVIGNSRKNKQEYGYSIAPLDFSKNIFPSLLEETKKGQVEYSKLWEIFFKEFNLIDPKNPSSFTETLLFLLKKYTWCIPASTKQGDLPNTSLFDHLKTTAAIADCLIEYSNCTPDSIEFKDQKVSLQNNHFPLMLFCGDISGIQNFIYNITASKAAMSLKGRSFYLQLLTESIIQRIIKDCEITSGHIVYASGGKFYMLLPNTKKVKTILSDLEREIALNLKNEGFTDLYLCMDYIPFRYDFKDSKGAISIEEEQTHITLSELWTALLNKTAVKKNQKYRFDFSENFNDYFNPKGTGSPSVCDITGKEGKLVKLEQDSDIMVLESVRNQIWLGKSLKDACAIVSSTEGSIRGVDRERVFHPLQMGVEFVILRNKESISTDNVKLLCINSTDFIGSTSVKGNSITKGFTMYGGNDQAIHENGEFKTFDLLAGDENDGFKKLGILRMDVDNLGLIFSNGLPGSTLAKYSTLSGFLDMYFSGYLNIIRNKYEDTVNILYSGGDDVFAIGKWDDIISFAADIRKDFGEYVCNRDELSISGGVAIVNGKFPMAKAAELAGNAEDKAKSYVNDSEISKNAINIFEENINWGDEFDFVISFSEQLHTWITNKAINKGILHKFYAFRYLMKKGLESWRWLSAYTFARYAKDSGKGQIELNELKTILSTGKSGDYHFKTSRMLELICVAARITEFKLRNQIQ